MTATRTGHTVWTSYDSRADYDVAYPAAALGPDGTGAGRVAFCPPHAVDDLTPTGRLDRFAVVLLPGGPPENGDPDRRGLLAAIAPVASGSAVLVIGEDVWLRSAWRTLIRLPGQTHQAIHLSHVWTALTTPAPGPDTAPILADRSALPNPGQA